MKVFLDFFKGRVVFWNMGITNSFTLEASYGGSNMGKSRLEVIQNRMRAQLVEYVVNTFCIVDTETTCINKMLYKNTETI